jgi:hypothetical protein
MRIVKASCLLAILVAAAFTAGIASAHGGHRHYHHRSHLHFGFHFGAPAYWYPGPRYYYPPAYYYPPVVAVPAEPTRYIERGDAYSPPEQQPGYWYYCQEAKAYYPYVQQCAGGWQRVNPTPQS